MNTILHKAETRGFANHGWLKSFHTFSFANYYNPERMRFGTLRVLNDDTIDASKGFDTHPHENMEIISIPLEGDLEHKDSMGNVSIIKKGDVQVMSAGTGIMHSEYNYNNDRIGKFLQIWIYPNKKGVEPRYGQITINSEKNKLIQILSPSPDDEGVWIHQNAWFNLGNFDAEQTFKYILRNNNNGVYVFVISGQIQVADIELKIRDGLGITDTDLISFKTISETEVLIMEVPMNV